MVSDGTGAATRVGTGVGKSQVGTGLPDGGTGAGLRPAVAGAAVGTALAGAVVTAPWQAIIPCLVFAVTVFALYSVGDWLRARLDVRGTASD